MEIISNLHIHPKPQPTLPSEHKKLIIHLDTKDNPENYNIWAWSEMPKVDGKTI